MRRRISATLGWGFAFISVLLGSVRACRAAQALLGEELLLLRAHLRVEAVDRDGRAREAEVAVVAARPGDARAQVLDEEGVGDEGAAARDRIGGALGEGRFHRGAGVEAADADHGHAQALLEAAREGEV